MVLDRIATANPDCVIALPPSGLRDAFLRVLRRLSGVTVAIHDTPEHILERITFYDIDSRRIDKHLTGEERPPLRRLRRTSPISSGRMSGRTCMSLSLALTPRPARQPSTPGWAVPERGGAGECASRTRLSSLR